MEKNIAHQVSILPILPLCGDSQAFGVLNCEYCIFFNNMGVSRTWGLDTASTGGTCSSLDAASTAGRASTWRCRTAANWQYWHVACAIHQLLPVRPEFWSLARSYSDTSFRVSCSLRPDTAVSNLPLHGMFSLSGKHRAHVPPLSSRAILRTSTSSPLHSMASPDLACPQVVGSNSLTEKVLFYLPTSTLKFIHTRYVYLYS